MKTTTLLVTLAMLLPNFTLTAQPGSLSSDFASNGIFTFDLTSEDEIQDMALLSDGSIIVSGYVNDESYDGIIMRVSKTGQLIWSKQIDISGNFSVDQFNGLVVLNDEIYVQGNFYNSASAKFEINVFKFDMDGNPMSDYGTNGKAIAVQGNGFLGFEMYGDDDGNLYVVGRTYFFSSNMEDGLVVKFNPNGELDQSFGDGGISILGIGSLRTGFLEGMLIDNEFYAVGWFLNTADAIAFNQNGIVVKLKADGTLDTNFGSSGNIYFNKSTDDIIDDIVQHGDDHFLIGATSGSSSDDIYVMRYNLFGDLDLNFGSDGIVKLNYGSDDDAAEILVRQDLAIYVCASVNQIEDFALISLNADGSSDSSFGSNGKIVINIKNNDNVSEGLIMPNGDVLLGGESDESNNGDFAIVRITGYPTCSDSDTNMSIRGCEEVVFDGTTYDQSGTFNLVYQTAQGCDSTIHLLVNIDQPSQETINLSDCGPITVNAETYSMSGSYTQMLVAQNGCDSTLTINFNLKNTSQETLTLTDCEVVLVNDQNYSTSGTYIQNLTAQNGCDSILTLNIDIENLEVSIVENESGMLVSESDASQYQWYNCATNVIVPGEASNTYTPTETGDYALIISSEMCADTSDCINVTISGTSDLIDLSTANLFPNPTESVLFIRGIDQSNISKINLYNISGINIPHNIQETRQGLKLDVNQLISGLYYVQLWDNVGNHKVLSFVKG